LHKSWLGDVAAVLLPTTFDLTEKRTGSDGNAEWSPKAGEYPGLLRFHMTEAFRDDVRPLTVHGEDDEPRQTLGG
jgi:hypothetical protein